MRRASYRQAVEWIGLRLPIPVDTTEIEQMELALFVAFLFDVAAARVATDVARSRVRDTVPNAAPTL